LLEAGEEGTYHPVYPTLAVLGTQAIKVANSLAYIQAMEAIPDSKRDVPVVSSEQFVTSSAIEHDPNVSRSNQFHQHVMYDHDRTVKWCLQAPCDLGQPFVDLSLLGRKGLVNADLDERTTILNLDGLVILHPREASGECLQSISNHTAFIGPGSK